MERDFAARLDFAVDNHVAHAVVQEVAFGFQAAEGVLEFVG